MAELYAIAAGTSMIYMNGTAGKMAISDNGEVRTAFIRAKADAERQKGEAVKSVLHNHHNIWIRAFVSMIDGHNTKSPLNLCNACPQIRRGSPGLKAGDTEMMGKSRQNSVSLHFGTPESDRHGFNGELA